MKIRKATARDLSRIAEILVFAKRVNYRSIFRDDPYSFGVLQVLPVAEKYADPGILEHIWVYEEEFVKGLLHMEGEEIKELYVDSFFAGQGIGGELIEFAKGEQGARFLWTIEKTRERCAFMNGTAFTKRKPGN